MYIYHSFLNERFHTYAGNMLMKTIAMVDISGYEGSQDDPTSISVSSIPYCAVCSALVTHDAFKGESYANRRTSLRNDSTNSAISSHADKLESDGVHQPFEISGYGDSADSAASVDVRETKSRNDNVDTSSYSFDEHFHCGWLEKRRGFLSTWRRGWFIIADGHLVYYACRSDVGRAAPKGVIHVPGIGLEDPDASDCYFILQERAKGKVVLKSDSLVTKRLWLRSITLNSRSSGGASDKNVVSGAEMTSDDVRPRKR